MSLDVNAWLEANGFGRYQEQFAANEIDGEALVGLTDEHLREMAIPVGPRIKLLKAIAELTTSEPAPGASVEPAVAERRQLTVMFVDLVGSTALSAMLDPEDLRDIIRSYQSVIAETVAEFGGHIAQYLGDGALVFFGYPVAVEDAAERAVRAALQLPKSLHGLHNPNDLELEVRVGIATGLVVVGDLIGEGDAKENAVVGETPNLAARLQSVAQPGQIIVAASTRELTGHLFELEPLEPLTLKGIPEAVSAYVVAGEHAAESRFEARQPGTITPMVGRESELELLRAHWQKVVDGEGQLAVISGDPGIGKSRIVRALRDTLEPDSYFRTSYQCSPHHGGSALYPVVQQILRVAGIRLTDSPDAQLDNLEALLVGTSSRAKEEIALIAALLGIETGDRYPPIELSPEQQRQRTFDALINQIMALAARQPVLIVVEDAHWIDPTTLELIEIFASRLKGRRIMILVTSRPTDRSFFADIQDASQITLNRLGQTQIAALIQTLTRGKSLPDQLMREIARKTDGVPLFAEELTKTLLESGELEETREAFVVGEADLALPASLQDSLMARLDRLQPVKEVAQSAACIGRDFDLAMLGAVLPIPQDALLGALDRLVEADMVISRGAPPEATYTFRHALVRDAAYESLLRSKRQQIHGRIFSVLENREAAAPEVVAYHATQAGQREVAIAWWQKAAASAMARPAFKETVTHLNQAIRLSEQMGDDAPWPETRLGQLLALGQACMAARGYGHADTVDAFTRARAVSETLPKMPYRFTITYGLWVATYLRGEQEKAIAIAEDMVAWAEEDQKPGHMISGLRSLGISQNISRTSVKAERSFRAADRISEDVPTLPPERRAAVAQRFAADPEIGTRFHHALAVWALGRVAEAYERTEAALAEARAMNHVHTLAHALTHAGIFSVIARDTEWALAVTTETLAYADEYDLQMWKGYGLGLKACALAFRGDDVDSAELMEQGFQRMARSETRSMICFHHGVQMRTLARLKRFEDAEVYAELVRQELQAGSERYLWPECHRLLGDYLALSPAGKVEAVGAAYQAAVDCAKEQQSPSFRLYAALGLATHQVERGDEAAARELLETELAGFPEDGKMPARDEARQLLEQL